MVLRQFLCLRQFVTEHACEEFLRPHPLPALPAFPAFPDCPVADNIEATGARKTKRAVRASPAVELAAPSCVLEELYCNGPDIQIAHAFERCPALHKVGVSKLPITRHPAQVPFLTACSLARISSLTVTIEAVTHEQMAQVRGLKELALHNCSALTDETFFLLARNNPALQVLCIRKAGVGSGDKSQLVTEHALLAFLTLCPQLRYVEFIFSCYEGKVPTTHGYTKAMFNFLLRKQCPDLKVFKCNIV